MLNRRPASSLSAVAAALIGCCAGHAQTPEVAITRVNLVDVANGRIIPNSTVTISGGTIASVTQSGAPKGVRVVDGRGRFLIPGLWDMHAHTGGGTTINPWHKAWLQLYVANGVTGIRDMGSDALIFKMKEAAASGSMLGPGIFTAGPILDDAPA